MTKINPNIEQESRTQVTWEDKVLVLFKKHKKEADKALKKHEALVSSFKIKYEETMNEIEKIIKR